jgi:hypothetical protein
MKESIRHGGVVRCDMAFVDGEQNFKNECSERFVTYSVASRARAQAANADWARAKVKLVKWPGNPPAGDNKKVDLCPKHSALVMATEEYKAHKLKLKEQRKAEKLAKKNAPKKPRKLRAKKGSPASP